MRKLMVASLLAGQILIGAQPAIAAGPSSADERRMGAFGGLRVRLPLDGDVRRRRIRAGIALAPTIQTASLQGETRTRIAEGVEFGFRSGETASLSIAGMPVSRLAEGPSGPDGRRVGVSTLGWVAIGVGSIVALLGVTYLVFEDLADCDEDEECS